MRFRPCIDLHGGKVKQIVGGTLTDRGAVTNFETDRSPADFATMYRRDGLLGGHVIMLGPGNEAAAREALAAFPGGLQAGGGMTPRTAPAFLEAGASHAIVTSYAFREGRLHEERLAELAAAVGRERLVLDLSCVRKGDRYLVATDRWQKVSDVPVTRDTLSFLAGYACEFLVHAVEVEGKRGGIDEGLVALLAECSPLPATYAGGVRSLEDLERVRALGGGRVDVTVGSALDIFGGSLPYREVVAFCSS